jgi:membrane fusion protein (multidrug efflux system)
MGSSTNGNAPNDSNDSNDPIDGRDGSHVRPYIVRLVGATREPKAGAAGECHQTQQSDELERACRRRQLVRRLLARCGVLVGGTRRANRRPIAIRAQVSGYLISQDYQEGSIVKPGDLLFRIDRRPFQATLAQTQGDLERAQAELERNRLDVVRYTPLVKEGAVSQQELDDAVQARAGSSADVDSARAAVEQAQLNLQWTKVKSPITGVVAIAIAAVGDLVSPDTLLTSVSQLDPIKVNFPVSEIDYLRFAKQIRELSETGQPSPEARLELILANGERYPEKGRFNVAGLAVTTTTGTIDAQGLFPNPNNLLRPGQFAKIRAVTDRIPGAVVIPQRAVRDLQGLTQVAVVGAEDKVSFKTVKLGPATGSDYVVESGLAAGERVVTEGLQKVRDGVVVKPTAPPAPSAASGDAPPAPAAGS